MKIISAALLTFLSIGTAHADQIQIPKLEETIESGKLGKITSVVVEQNGSVVYEKYFGKGSKTALNDVRSAGKSITAMALGIAIANNKTLSVDANAWSILGATETSEYSDIKIRDLLTMSSKLDCNDWDEKSHGNEENMYPKKVWRKFAMSIPTVKNYQRDSFGFGRFSYCTAGAFLIGQIVEQQSGQRFDKFVEEHLFQPLNIAHSKWKRSPTAEVQSGGQLRLRSTDLVRLGRLALNGGSHQGQQIISKEWVKEMLTPYRRATSIDDFGYLWWLRAFRSGEKSYSGWYMSGNGGNKVAIFKELDAVIVVTSTNYNKRGMHQFSTDIIERTILPKLSKKTP